MRRAKIFQEICENRARALYALSAKYLFSAEGAVSLSSLGQRPRIR